MKKTIAVTCGLTLLTLLSAAVRRPMPEPNESAQFDQAQALATLRTRIARHENEPAQKVLRNIRVLKKVPAERLLAIPRPKVRFWTFFCSTGRPGSVMLG